MRRLLPLALLIAGCQDYGKLEEDFCTTALAKGVTSCNDFEYTLYDSVPVLSAGIMMTPITTGGGVLKIERYAGPDPHDGDVVRYAGPRLTTNIARGTSGQDDPSNAYRGTGSLLVTLPDGGPAAALMGAALPDPATTSGAVSVRFFVYTGNTPPPGTFEMVRWTSANGSTLRTLAYVEGALRITDGLSGRTSSTAVPLSSTAWHCIEVDYGVTNAGTEGAPMYQTTVMNVAVDQLNRRGPDLSLPGLPNAGSVGAIDIGPNRTGASGPAVQLWMDEAIVSSHYIGCSI
ncbi:MAG: hypothetical protein ABI321_04900 [Polyangia bacterium]